MLSLSRNDAKIFSNKIRHKEVCAKGGKCLAFPAFSALFYFYILA